jgi:hypothetical protein
VEIATDIPGNNLSNPKELLQNVATNIDDFEFGRMYWIKIEGDEPVTLYLAPPQRDPDGTIGNN